MSKRIQQKMSIMNPWPILARKLMNISKVYIGKNVLKPNFAMLKKNLIWVQNMSIHESIKIC